MKRVLLKQEHFSFDTRKQAKAEATRIGLRDGEFEIARDGGGYFIVWVVSRKSIESC